MSHPEQILIAGLGNPGPAYAATRHNAGFWFADAVVDRFGGAWKVDSKFFGESARVKIEGVDVLLLKPATFMNRSGQSVQAMANFYKLPAPNILVAHDELDMPSGQMRLKLGGGHGGHNGLRDIHKPLGEGYRRLRVGIGHPGDKNLVLNYVLARPSKADEQLIRAGIDHAVNALPVWLGQTWEKAMNQLHTS